MESNMFIYRGRVRTTLKLGRGCPPSYFVARAFSDLISKIYGWSGTPQKSYTV